ncbi:hypothetical protein EAE99_007833 [Botrytis elliptica]|nr:hypothetical protein EAE99_007833 [Botrytis elliptica]
MTKDSPSTSSSLESGSKVEQNSTNRIETEEGSNKPVPKPSFIETYGLNSPQDHSFDHVLDGLPSSSTMPPSKLCAVCQNMVDELGHGNWLERSERSKLLSSDTGILHVRNPLSLKTSAQDGCSLCATFIRTDDEKGRDAIISRHIDGWKAKFGEAPIPCSRVSLINFLPPIESPKIKLEFATDPHWKNQSLRVSFIASLGISPEIYNQVFENIDANSNTSQSTPLIENWLNACQTFHPKCKFQRPEFIPTRLIDLQGDHPRLCLGNQIEKRDIQYAALSHCWGTPEKKYQTLTKSTLKDYLAKIEMEDLSKTFHDAIEVCMKLKIRYIWIDSLCIIQDDKEDWRRESVTMVDVYGSCLLNIAASSSIDGSQGCFFDRRDAVRCRISLKINGKNDAMYDCKQVTKHPLSDPNICPLETRGWTLQERLLSPRTVHFTREEVFWECHTKFVSESSPFDFGGMESRQKETLSIGMWNKIVMDYSGRHLTYEADRLIALAGIAAKIQQKTKDEYVAGMWCNNLIWQLCWDVSRHYVGRRSSPRRAPTWSWASVAAPITIWEMYEFRDFPLSKVLRVDKPANQHQFSDMPNAALWLSCPPLLVDKGTPPYIMVVDGEFIPALSLTFDCEEDKASFNMDSDMCNLYILRLFDDEALILRRIEGTQGLYKRLGLLSLFIGRQLDPNDEANHAEKTAYVPREKHGFDTDEHVICLV